MNAVVQFSLPGVAPEHLSVEQTGRVLSVRAVRPLEPGVRYLRRQIPGGRFEAHYRLPPHVEVERASLQHGVLTLHVVEHVPEALRPRVIPIATSGPPRRLGRPARGWLERLGAWVRRQLPTGLPARA
jgi:molecular chaperone IbpA